MKSQKKISLNFWFSSFFQAVKIVNKGWKWWMEKIAKFLQFASKHESIHPCNVSKLKQNTMNICLIRMYFTFYFFLIGCSCLSFTKILGTFFSFDGTRWCFFKNFLIGGLVLCTFHIMPSTTTLAAAMHFRLRHRWRIIDHSECTSHLLLFNNIIFQIFYWFEFRLLCYR